MSNQASLGDISGSSEPSEKENKDSQEFYDGIQLVDIGPSEWSPEKLSQACNVQSGLSWSKDQEVDDPEEGDIPVIKIDNVSDGELELEDPLYLREVSEEQIEKNKANKNWIVMIGSNGSQQRIAKCGMIHENMDFVYASFLFGIKPKTDALNPYFLYYFLNSSKVQKRIQSFTSGSTSLNNLNKSVLEKIVVPSPGKDEQRRIASVLYNVDQAISKTEEIIEQTQRVKKGLMQDLFTEGYYSHEEFQETRLGPKKIEIPKEWEITRFRDVSEVQQGLQIAKSKRYKEDGENRYRYITVQHLKDPEDEKQRWFIEDPREKVICTEEDVLMTRTGNTGQVVTDVEGVFHNNFFKVDFDRDLLNKKFLVAYLRSEMVQNLLISYAGITTIPDLNHADFGRIPLLVPPKEEQEKIADSLISLEEKIEQEKEQKEQLQRLKKGLMQDLLTGSVRTGEDVRVLDEVVEVEG